MADVIAMVADLIATVTELFVIINQIKIMYSVVIPSATQATTSAYIPTVWPFHLPQGNNISPSHLVAIPSATNN